MFAPFRSPGNETQRDRENAADLFATYLGYLRWQKKNVLDDEQARLEVLLGKLLAGYTPNAADLKKWADARDRGVELGTYWLPEDAVVGTDGAVVAAAWAAWALLTVREEVVAPATFTPLSRHW